MGQEGVEKTPLQVNPATRHRGIPMNLPDATEKPDLAPAVGAVAGELPSSATPVRANDDIALGIRLVATALAAGVLAGVLAWGIGEGVHGTFVPPSKIIDMPMAQGIRISFEDQVAADGKNATLAFAALGGVLGVVLGVAGGIIRKSTVGAVTGAVVGLVAGCAITVGATWGLLPFYFRALERSQDAMSHELLLPLLVHSGIWAAAGLAGGVALGIGMGTKWTQLYNAALGGMIGAALGAVVYEVLGAILLPGDRTFEPVSTTWQGRLLARLLVAVSAALMAAVVMSAGTRPRPVPQPKT
jgi:hypothetical protein